MLDLQMWSYRQLWAAYTECWETNWNPRQALNLLLITEPSLLIQCRLACEGSLVENRLDYVASEHDCGGLHNEVERPLHCDRGILSSYDCARKGGSELSSSRQTGTHHLALGSWCGCPRTPTTLTSPAVGDDNLEPSKPFLLEAYLSEDFIAAKEMRLRHQPSSFPLCLQISHIKASILILEWYGEFKITERARYIKWKDFSEYIGNVLKGTTGHRGSRLMGTQFFQSCLLETMEAHWS